MARPTNPIITTLDTMHDCGWDIVFVRVRRESDGSWWCEIGVCNNVSRGWTWPGSDNRARPYQIVAPPDGPLAGHPGVTLECWGCRPPEYRWTLPRKPECVYESWMRDVATVGGGLDLAVDRSRGVYLTKPDAWVRGEAGDLLRKSKAEHIRRAREADRERRQRAQRARQRQQNSYPDGCFNPRPHQESDILIMPIDSHGVNPASRDAPLRKKYGGKVSEAINRAIRAEIRGGAAALDTLTILHNAADRVRWGDGLPADADDPPQVSAYYDCLDRVRAMEAEVRARYGLAPAPSPEDDADTRRSRGRRRGHP